ncbi:transcriptional regulator with XRE-family HTH domain [Streptomyces sp. B4I13]|uniref:helix-turn-helix domain-containing protein n=1 Tax=Streptomyces sp. B4I13 TaxID=3042271 RepID=UPI00278A62D5|nr:helix-turn-helix transcriptional regulator [Streptomyces sp. B4I13]MDQ0961942.1 transcriptional regulator with XRE-family HTH domain [Streptomyces sp. B4I13]
MDAQKKPAPPPEAVLIREALKQVRMSGREAARRSGVSDARWRQITTGYQTVSGHHVPVVAPAETLARMAQATQVTADELRKAGRSDAADELERLSTPSPSASVPSQYADDPHISAIAALLATLPPDAQDEVLRRVRRGSQTRDQEDSGPQWHAS